MPTVLGLLLSEGLYAHLIPFFFCGRSKAHQLESWIVCKHMGSVQNTCSVN